MRRGLGGGEGKRKGKGKDEGEGDATERMVRINAAAAEKLAGQHTRSLFHPYLHGWWINDADNILVSDRYASHFSDLIRKSHETDPHVRVLFYLRIGYIRHPSCRM
jgi:hypothetical protein